MDGRALVVSTPALLEARRLAGWIARWASAPAARRNYRKGYRHA